MFLGTEKNVFSQKPRSKADGPVAQGLAMQARGLEFGPLATT